MALPQTTIDIIATRILLDAKSALASLQEFSDGATTARERIDFLKRVIKSAAAQMGGDFKKAEAAVRSFAGSLSGIKASEISQAGRELRQVGERGESAFKRIFSSVNALRIALGAIISMLLFQAIQAVNQFVSKSVKQFTELEESLFRIGAAEKVLSEAGIEVSVSGLKSGVSELRKELKIFSEEELTKLVGQLSVLTKELGFSEEQILALAKATAVKNLVSPEVESLDQTAGKLVTTLLTNQSKGAATLGIALSNADIEAKALEMHLLEAGEAASELSDKEKDLVKLQIILDSAAGDSDKLSEFLSTNSAKVKENTAAWEELQVTAGGFFASFIPALTPLLRFITDGINGVKLMTVLFHALQVEIIAFWMALNSSLNPKIVLENIIQTIKDVPKIFDEVLGNEIPSFFATIPPDAPEWFKDLFGKYLTDVETATSETAKFKDELEDEDALEALEDIDQKIQDIILSAKQAQEDLDLKLVQKQDDLNLEYDRKGEDAARKHGQKLADINQDALDKIEDAKRKAREDERKAEQDLLQKLKELRNQFLMDLDEALHARDARQVLRLIKEYKNDKQNILDRKKLDDQQRKDRLAEDLKAIELERRRRIESENIEYARKLADLNEAKAREQADLQLWYQREQEDIQRNIEQKLQRLIDGYITEGKIHEENQAAIYATLVKYFGKDTAVVNSLAEFMAQRFAQIGQMAAQASQAVQNLSYGTGGGLGNSSGDSLRIPRTPRIRGGARRMAEGGTIIASRPTSAIFGERGMEAATFTPLGRTGKDINKVFGDVSFSGANGQAQVLLSLSPELRGEIVSDAMNGVAVVIEHVRRER